MFHVEQSNGLAGIDDVFHVEQLCGWGKKDFHTTAGESPLDLGGRGGVHRFLHRELTSAQGEAIANFGRCPIGLPIRLC